MSQFIVERKSQDSAMTYKMVVRINGGEKIELLPGEQKEIDLTDGSYEVVASLNLQKKALMIEMPQENKIIISFTNGVQIESPNRAKEYDLGATSAPIVEKGIEEPIVTSSETISEASTSGGNKMYCTQCGGQIEKHSKFCKHCGVSVEKIVINTDNQASAGKNANIVGIILTFVIMALAIGFVAKYCFTMFRGVSDEKIYQEAETEIKGEIYESYGEIPVLSSEMLYSVKEGKAKDSIVVVKYQIKDTGFGGSYAVHIRSGVKDTFFRSRTEEHVYNYDYGEVLDELITIFKIKENGKIYASKKEKGVIEATGEANGQNEDIEFAKNVDLILDRAIFMSKKSTPQVYTDIVYNIEAYQPFKEDWKIGDVLNETYFVEDTISWDNKGETEQLGSIIEFQGHSKKLDADVVIDFRVLNENCSFLYFEYPGTNGTRQQLGGIDSVKNISSIDELTVSLMSYEVVISMTSTMQFVGIEDSQFESQNTLNNIESQKEILPSDLINQICGEYYSIEEEYLVIRPKGSTIELWINQSAWGEVTSMVDEITFAGQKNDGKKFEMICSDGMININTSDREFSFMPLDYEPEVRVEYILPNSDSDYLSEIVLYDLTANERRLARNEIYARHGRIFNDEELRNYFESKAWYTPTISAEDFTDDLLNDYELSNLQMMEEYERSIQ